MTTVIFIFVTLLAAALQAAVPTFASTGYAPLPFLLGVVIYYALMHRPSRMLQAAVLIGLLDDSLGQMPLGFSSFCYATICLVVARFRDAMTVRSWITQAFLGATANFATTFFTWLLLAKDGELHWPIHWLLFKFAGSFVNGALLVPVIFAALFKLDNMLGHTHDAEEAHPL